MPARKPRLLRTVIAIIVGLGVLSVAGFYGRQYVRCQSLEDDYLNSVSAARQAVLLRELAPESDALAKVAAGLTDVEIDGAERYLGALYEDCGERAGRSAFRKGTGIMLRGEGGE